MWHWNDSNTQVNLKKGECLQLAEVPAGKERTIGMSFL
jgi:hypothetical protein